MILEHPIEDPSYDEVELGAGMAAAGDVDGDGVGDLWVGRDSTGIAEGVITGYSGRDGHAMQVLGAGLADDAWLQTWHFGTSIVAIGDLDADGVSEILVGADHSLSHEPGWAYVFSGRTGRRMFALRRVGTNVVIKRG